MATSNERPVNFNLDRTQNRFKINESNELDTLTFIDFNPYIRRSYVKSLFTKQETYGYVSLGSFKVEIFAIIL